MAGTKESAGFAGSAGLVKITRFPLFFVLLFFVLLFFMGSLVSLLGQEESAPEVSLSVDPMRGRRRTLFSITLRAPFSMAERVVLSDPEIPEGLALIAGPFIRPVQEEGVVETEVTLRLRGDVPGIYRLGPFSLTDGQRVLSTDSRDVIVLEYDEVRRDFPLLAGWEAPEGPFIVGQTFPLTLMIENLSDIVFPDPPHSVSPAGALMERAEGLGEISTREVNGQEVYNIPGASWMVTPTRAGQLRIPSLSVVSQGLRRATGSYRVEVLPLPEEVSASGAVGDFSLAHEISADTLSLDEEVSLTIKVEGWGNLSYLEMPEPRAESFELLGREEESRFSPGMRGFEGERLRIYRYIPREAGDQTIRIPSWSWVNPVSGNVNTLPARAINLTIKPAAAQEESFADIPLLSPAEVLLTQRPLWGQRWYHYLLMAPGFLLLLGVVLFRHRRRFRLLVKVMIGSLVLFLLTGAASPDGEEPRRRPPSWLLKAYELPDIREALEQWQEVASRWPRTAGVWYNLGAVSHRAGDEASAVGALRQALILRPAMGQARRALHLIEEDLGLEQQYATTSALSPEVHFFLLVGSFNLLSVGALLLLRRRNGAKVILFVTLSVIFAGTLGLAGADRHQRNQPMGYIAQDVSLKKVPGELGRSWLTLPAGTTLRIQGQAEGDYLILTGYDLEGWVDESEIILFR